MQDNKTIEEIIMHLRSLTSTSMRAVVVIDADIATEENLAMLSENNFDYVCVSRAAMWVNPIICFNSFKRERKTDKHYLLYITYYLLFRTISEQV
jgi:hypothetical protein